MPAVRTSLPGLWLSALLLGPPPAAACTCMTPPPSRQTVPAADTTGFPTDGLVRIFLEGSWPLELRPEVSHEYRLRGPDGELVDMQARLSGTMVELAPTASLAAEATYTLERAFPYRHGRLLTDAQRWAAATGDQAQPSGTHEIALRWFPDRSFTTGSGPEDRVPRAPSIREARAATQSNGADCGPGEAVTVDLELPDDLLPTDVLAVELAGQGIGWRAPYRPPPGPGAAASPSRAQVSDLLCTADKVHVQLEDGAVEVRALVISAADRVVSERGWTRAAVRSDDDPSSLPEDHGPVDHSSARTQAAVARVLAIPSLDGPLEPAPGPEACPHGLQAVERTVLPDQVWPQRGRGVVAELAGTPWVLVEAEGGRSRVPVSLGGPTTPTLEPLGSHDTLSDHGDALLRRTATRGHGKLDVAWHEDDGTLVWRTLLGVEEAQNAHEFAVVGEDRVLVGWHRWEPGWVRHEHWSLLGLADGSLLAQGDMATFSPESRQVDAGVWHQGHFMLAWTWGRPPVPREPEHGPDTLPEGSYLTWLDPEGTPVRTVAQPEELGRIQALHVNRQGLIAMGSDSGDLVLGRLGGDGAVAGAPVLLNAGTPGGGNPHLGSWGELSVALWNARSLGAWVTIVDQVGVAARPLRLGTELGSLDAVLHANLDRLHVGYGESGHLDGNASTVFEELACRDAPMAGPPPLLAPEP